MAFNLSLMLTLLRKLFYGPIACEIRLLMYRKKGTKLNVSEGQTPYFDVLPFRLIKTTRDITHVVEYAAPLLVVHSVTRFISFW